jgi:hypothetical protein
MKLVLSSGDEFSDPTDEQIERALGQLDVERDGEGFAVLERDQMSYLQVGGDRRMGFDMEYQAGDRQNHFRCDRQDFSLDEAVQALIEYRDGRIEWDRYGNWSRITW